MKKVLEKIAMALILAGTFITVNPANTLVNAAIDMSQYTESQKESLEKYGDRPWFSANLMSGYTFVNSVDPNIQCLNGTITDMTLDGKPYDGSLITTIGTHNISANAVSYTGEEATFNMMFKVAGIITTEMSTDDIVNMIENSSGQELIININEGAEVLEAKVFKTIKDLNKNVVFTLYSNNTQWIFEGENIEEDKLCDVNLSVESRAADGEIAHAIESAASDAEMIHFNHHGQLPGKVTIKLYQPDRIREKLTLYYFNDVTNKIEKIAEDIEFNREGQGSFDITHCSDYFLSADNNIPEGPWLDRKIEVDNTVIKETEKLDSVEESEALKNDVVLNNNESIKTGDTDNICLALLASFISAFVCLNSRRKQGNNA